EGKDQGGVDRWADRLPPGELLGQSGLEPLPGTFGGIEATGDALVLARSVTVVGPHDSQDLGTGQQRHLTGLRCPGEHRGRVGEEPGELFDGEYPPPKD